MNKLNIYQRAQLAVFIVFLSAFIVTGALVILDPSAPVAAKEIFSELKLFFAGLLSVNALKAAQNRFQGDATHETPVPADSAHTDAERLRLQQHRNLGG